MPALSNPQFEKFARLLAGGAAKVDAYLQIEPSVTSGVARARASRLSQQSDIQERLIELLETGAEDASWTLAHRLEYLQAVAQTSHAAMNEKSPICQGIKHTALGVEYKMPDKLAALALYGKLSGDSDPAPSRDLLGELMGAIRAGTWGERARNRPVRQKRGHPLANARHEVFAQLVASGERAAYAYAKVYDVPSLSAVEGYRLKQRPEVAARIREIQNLGAARAGWTRQLRLRYLRDFALTPIGDLTEASPYCQGVKRTRLGVELKIPCRIKAVALYSELARLPQKDKQPLTIEQIATSIRSRGNLALANGTERSLLTYLSQTTG